MKVLGWLALACASAVSLSARPLRAQVAANETWRTLSTPHFEVHFTPPLEREARHAAAIAEVAYANLSTELHPPRGTIDIVISDAADISNGSASVTPRNRVIIYARPPVDEVSLESYDDWTVLVLQHELTHIFHLDRTRGWWRAAQYVFGRNPVLFPNYYTPAWLTEGLAVYYESRFTSGGRLEGSYQAAVARAAAVDHRVPTLGQLSLATSRFPYGQSVYVYGSFVWDDLARRHGAATVPAFVERSSAATIPFLLDHQARATFGESFTHAWNTWRDSALRGASDALLVARVAADSVPLAPSRAMRVSGGGRYVIEPRWRDATTLVYAGNDGRQSQGLYEVTLGGTPHRLARRNSLDASAPTPEGGVVFSQGEFVDRFHTRGDLYAGTSTDARRLTVGARLSEPAVRRDGRIVAVQTTPGATRLVTLAADGTRLTPISAPAMDTQWTAPRWSPSGARIVAVRIARGMEEIVTLDSAGGDVRVLGRGRAVLRSPVFTPAGDAIVFTSDESGVSQLYALRVDARGVALGEPVVLTRELGGVYGADVVRSGGDSVRVATTALRGDGYHLLVWTVAESTLRPSQSGAARIAPGERGDVGRWRVPDDTTRSRRYSPWRTLLPTYWSPTFAQETPGRGSLAGALTSASDVVGRHSYVAQAAVNTRNSNVDASLQYIYNRLLEPSFNVGLEQSWSYANIFGKGLKVGDLERRIRVASLHATFVRPRARTYSALTVGGEIEERDYATTPAALRARLDPFYSATHRYPTLVAGAVFANTQRPTLSISPEDGISATAVARQRWETSGGAGTRSVVAITSAYKSLDLPGFAHHVLALRLAGGFADSRAPTEFEVGGVSGSSLEVVPGVALGGSARTFPVRGFAAASESGIYATSASAEYRVPLAMPSRGVGLFPLFVDRASLALFADAGRTACPARSTPACSPSATDGPTLASVGGELDLDSALQFDVPYRFRLGLAHPLRGREYAGASAATAYLTVGASF